MDLYEIVYSPFGTSLDRLN